MGGSWARWISNLFSPPVVWAILAFPIAFRQSETQDQGLFWAFIYVTLVCILPAIFVGVMVWRGSITDIHMQIRQQRIRPFIVSIICTSVAWALLRSWDAPEILPTFAFISLAQIIVMLIITFVWQISMHMMSVSSAVVTSAILFGPGAALLAFPLIPVVGAARLNLKRHTMSQLVGGCVLGAGMTALLMVIINPSL